MEVMIFSTTLQKITDDIENPFLKDSLKSLQNLSNHKLHILDWGNGKIAVPFNVNVDLPSLRNFEDLDIRAVEPIIIVFDIRNYPEKSPNIHTDRVDFPKNNLAHLYVAIDDRPPAICYVRENTDEWYANKRIEDVIIRISNWFRDAAIGKLTEDGEQFEPMRLEGYYSKIFYDYDTIMYQIIKNNSFPASNRFSIAQFEMLQNKRRTYKFIKKVDPDNLVSILLEIKENQNKNIGDDSKKDLCLALILWNDEDTINVSYSINLPKTWEDFKVFCSEYKINYSVLEGLIDELGCRKFPVIVGIRRPKPIIGYSGDLEFINFEFSIECEDVNDGKLIKNFSINTLSHSQYLTIKQAKKISEFTSDLSRAVVFGCGALGSKVIMHFARSGITNLTLVDPDSLASHNLVRHSLFADSVGENKAVSLMNKIQELFPQEELKTLSAPSFKDGLIYEKKTFEQYKWIFDFTASESFFNKITTIDSMNNCHIVSASISDFGNLGSLYKEGQNRNPRIDDLQVFLYSQGITDSKISEWLVRESLALNNTNLLVRVGIGCNSETTILGDEKISSHGSYFAGVLKKEIISPTNEGVISLNRIIDNEDYSIETKTIFVKPFDIHPSVNSDWTIRLKNGILKSIKDQSDKAGNNEIGGVMLGVCNHKTKIFYVTDLIKAPEDSEGNKENFLRGFQNLSYEIDNYNKKTGGQIGYIGEWHSHPNGPDFLSSTDMESVLKHKSELEALKTPLPVFLSIITPTGFYPYIF